MAKNQTNVVTVTTDELVVELSDRQIAERDFCEAVTNAVSKCEAGLKAVDDTGADVRNFYGSIDAFESDRATVKKAVIAGLAQKYKDAIAIAAVLPDLRTAAGKKLSDADKQDIKTKKAAAKNADAYAEVYVSRIRDAAWPTANDTNATDDDSDDGEETPKATDSDKARTKMAAFIEWLQKRDELDFDVTATIAALQVAQAKMQPSID
jgi:hypothetical protein